MDNLILDTDSYKASHFLQYPPGMTAMFSYIESRGGRYDRTVFFGLQYILKKYMTQRVTLEMVNEADAFLRAHGEPFPREGWEYIARDLRGCLPLKIRAVPEGSVVPTHNVLATIESTDPRVYWVVGWLETQLMRVWYPITVATQSYFIKQEILAALEKSADDPQSEIAFKLHDFGSRGVSSRESAEIGGMSHLVNFMGSDTIAGVWAANHYYHSAMAAFSIPAAEHSTITAWGKKREVDAYRNMLNQFAKPGAVLACVSDSYDLENAVQNLWGSALRDQVIASGATLVVRPDSGDPPTIVRRTLERLDAAFGHTLNAKGYRVLNHVRVIQGDGINQNSIRAILQNALDGGYSATNLTFGMGGALLQQLNRDTQKFAMKLSAVVINGRALPAYKDPVTDPAKKSKAGRLDLIQTADGYATITLPDAEPDARSALRAVFENGELLLDETLDAVRARVNQAARAR
ncbi:nicotinate phosphoribosyltransferase [Anaerolineae bacterium CFX7]|nr:nicotinate phosphoribosyltransferase [Anaerolineae bacterium CFX7]